MLRKIIICATAAVFICHLNSCNTKQNDHSENSQNHSEESVAAVQEDIYNVIGEDIPIRTGPGNKYSRLINKKASEMLHRTEYASIDYTCKVIVMETDGEWSQIQVVVPEWLSESHIGWVKSKDIINARLVKEKPLMQIDESLYEIMSTRHNSAVENFDVLIKYSGFDKDNLHEFTKAFREKHCTMNCNVNLYDSKAILPFVRKYPLERTEYLKMADHYLSMSSFDAPEVKSWYPYQDFKYREYGGKNWKKEPIEP